jgi:hypothetical protein
MSASTFTRFIVCRSSVFVSPGVNSTCTGLYLYDITSSSPDPELRKNKMAILLSAKAAEKQMILDYFFDPGIAGWSACYIQGIQIVD